MVERDKLNTVAPVEGICDYVDEKVEESGGGGSVTTLAVLFNSGNCTITLKKIGTIVTFLFADGNYNGGGAAEALSFLGAIPVGWRPLDTAVMAPAPINYGLGGNSIGAWTINTDGDLIPFKYNHGDSIYENILASESVSWPGSTGNYFI